METAFYFNILVMETDNRKWGKTMTVDYGYNMKTSDYAGA